MPRRSSFSRSSGNTKRNTRTAPNPTRTAPPQQRTGGGFFSNMMGSIGTGLGFGAGSEIGHQAVRGIFGGGSSQTHAPPQENIHQAQTNPQQNVCQVENTNFVECLKFNSNNINLCQEFLDNLKACENKFN